MKKLLVGVHVSISGNLDRAVDRAVERGCTTFQLFTRNPRGWKAKDLEAEAVERFREKRKRAGYGPVVAHMPYLPNLASPVRQIYDMSVEALTTEVGRCDLLDIPYLVVHLGSHMGRGVTEGIRRVSKACTRALEESPGETMILLENMAGTTNSVGSDFSHVRAIMDGIGHEGRVGVCLDTCHAFAAGYDLRSQGDVRRTTELLDDTVGLNSIRVLHLNDSVGALHSGLDRHEHIGMGRIGLGGFRAVLNVEAFRNLPLILETPIDERRDDLENLEVVRSLVD